MNKERCIVQTPDGKYTEGMLYFQDCKPIIELKNGEKIVDSTDTYFQEKITIIPTLSGELERTKMNSSIMVLGKGPIRRVETAGWMR